MNFVLDAAYKCLNFALDTAAWAVAKIYGLDGDK